jgi:molybdopterin molybdotransferase
VLEAGAEPCLLPPVPDDRRAAREAIRAGLSCGVLVLSGGVSVGEYDVVRDALADAGVSLDFWKVRMKPGKPVSFGRAGRIPVLGLPGNPVSTWLTFELFVRPGLRKMLGSRAPERPRARVRLMRALERKPGRTEFARARLVRSGQELRAELSEHQSSGSLSSLSGVDALVVLPAESVRIETDTELDALVLRPG